MKRSDCFESFTGCADYGGPVQHWSWARTNKHESWGFDQLGSCLLAGCYGKIILLGYQLC